MKKSDEEILTYGTVETEYATDDDDPHDRMESVAIWLGEKYIGQFERFHEQDAEYADDWTEWQFSTQKNIGEPFNGEIDRMLKALNAGTWNPG